MADMPARTSGVLSLLEERIGATEWRSWPVLGVEHVAGCPAIRTSRASARAPSLLLLMKSPAPPVAHPAQKRLAQWARGARAHVPWLHRGEHRPLLVSKAERAGRRTPGAAVVNTLAICVMSSSLMYTMWLCTFFALHIKLPSPKNGRRCAPSSKNRCRCACLGGSPPSGMVAVTCETPRRSRPSAAHA